MSSAETKGERRDSRRTSGYLPTLDGWRTIAVCMVMLCHMPHAGIRRGYLLTEVGAFGVDVFFAISGFLICTRLLEEERAHGRFSMGGFYLRRAFRILPASVFYLAVVGVLSLLRFFPLNWAGWWGALAFFRNYQVFPESAGFSDWPTAHFWSLGVEEHFYFLLPCLLLFFCKRRKTVLSVALAMSYGWLGYCAFHTPPAERVNWVTRTDLRISALIFPALLAVVFASRSARAYGRRFIRPASAMAALGLVVLARTLAHRADLSFQAGTHHLPLLDEGELLHLVVGPLLFPLLILATTFHPGTLISRFLELRFMRLVGRLSYGVYLWQQLFITPHYNPAFAIAGVQDNVLGLMVLAVVAVGSFMLLEQPAMKLGHRLTQSMLPQRGEMENKTGPVELLTQE